MHERSEPQGAVGMESDSLAVAVLLMLRVLSPPVGGTPSASLAARSQTTDRSARGDARILHFTWSRRNSSELSSATYLWPSALREFFARTSDLGLQARARRTPERERERESHVACLHSPSVK